VLGAVLRGRRVDRHAAHRVLGAMRFYIVAGMTAAPGRMRRGGVMVVMMMRVVHGAAD
jgi:hypothetical protein